MFTFALLHVTNNLLNILTPLQTIKNKNTTIKGHFVNAFRRMKVYFD